MPFPVKDRDVVFEYTRNQNPQSKTVNLQFKNIDGRYAIKDDFVRVPTSVSNYHLTPTADGFVTFDYFLKVDVGGRIPQWVINMAVSKTIISTVQSLYDYINTGIYKGVEIDGVVN